MSFFVLGAKKETRQEMETNLKEKLLLLLLSLLVNNDDSIGNNDDDEDDDGDKQYIPRGLSLPLLLLFVLVQLTILLNSIYE